MTRAFVVGNGISLRNTNLDLLNGEVTFATNRIHLLYDKTVWRPSYWVYTDMQDLGEAEWIKDVLLHIEQGYEIYLWSNMSTLIEMHRPPYNPLTDHVHYVGICNYHVSMDFNHVNRPTAWHLPTLCKFGTGSAVALQLAVLAEHNPIYVVGMDLGFVPRENKGDPDPNHFSEDYLAYDIHSRNQVEADRKNKTHQHAHAMAFAAAKERGIDIINATIGGECEAYPRVNYEELFK